MAKNYDEAPSITGRNWKIKEKEVEIALLQKEKEDLERKEEIKNIEALELSNHLKELKEKRDSINEEMIKTQLKLNKLCTHERIRKQYRNYSGGYLNRAEHWTDYFCDICGAKVDEKVKYGGFG
jgi:peptidoglycan hydrolase CwlO-like protein